MEQDKDLAILRHSTAHLLAQAVCELFPNTKLTIGPATSHGFFYDFQPETNFKESDLELISARMTELANQNLAITHEEISKEKAHEIYKNNPFKLELIDGIEGDTVGFSRQGDFYDLCRGGHVASTGLLKNFKLTTISGSYWRADRTGTPLQRISGIAFANSKDLRMFLQKQEEAAKYDHRKIGKEMDLFSFHEEGPGFPFFHPKGKQIINGLQAIMRKIWSENNYQEISTPTMLDEKLWQKSGHSSYYKQNMYFCNIDERDFALKPMNCPGALMLYNEKPRSFRELPLKLAEFGHVHRHELSGVLHGLFRVRAFTQDDSHIFCTQEQLEGEIIKIVQIIDRLLNLFEFNEISYAVSTKPDNAMGSDESWELATHGLTNALKTMGKNFIIQEGEGAFYGPKIEVKIKDSMDRQWQVSTVQVDFTLPKNFEISYIASGGAKQQPVMLHQANFGSLERFFGMLLEHTKGHIPFWLAPIQIKILPITDEQKSYAQTIAKILSDKGLRIELDESAEPLSAKIKVAQLARIPWMVVLGEKEVTNNTVTLRYVSGKQEFGLTLEQLLEKAENLQKI
ncbi:threonine--tRNA ligase [Candidatus Babeliales bacterium]|nr:threonine--tRNA ligase [Candidatus Babeliales bacterium]MBP9844345.1 threonine--tRNA ligase [Candidatus Babeliales bacterium]